MDKVAMYKEEIEKVASRAWKRNLGKIGEKGIDKLVDSGVLNRKKELKGLRRGTQNILRKENAKLYRNPEHAAGIYTRNGIDKAREQGVSISKEEIAEAKDMIKNMGAFGAPKASVKGMKHDSIVHVRKNADKGITKMVNEQIKPINVFNPGKLKTIKSIPRADRDSKKWMQAIYERHEADEVRMGKKVANNKKKMMNIEGNEIPSTQFASHLTPKVLMAESANVALAPKSAKNKMKHLRSYNAPLAGYKNTEMGSLKSMSGNKFQYGASGAYDKKTANKIEKAVSRKSKDAYRSLGYDV